MYFITTYSIQISLGLRDEYGVRSIAEVKAVCNSFIKEFHQKLTIIPTDIGFEPGAIVKFNTNITSSMRKKDLLNKAKILSMWLQEALGRIKISIITPEKTYNLE